VTEPQSFEEMVAEMRDAATEVLNDPTSDLASREFARSILASCETYERSLERERSRASRVRLDPEFVADHMDFPPAPGGGLGTDY